jgi:hypothetical protein
MEAKLIMRMLITATPTITDTRDWPAKRPPIAGKLGYMVKV